MALVTERRILDASRHIASPDKVPGSAAGLRSGDKKGLIPMENYGLRCMSTGFLVPNETPVIWRAPMVMGAMQQVLSDVA